MEAKDKLKVAKEYNLDIFIDDSLENCKAVSEGNIIYIFFEKPKKKEEDNIWGDGALYRLAIDDIESSLKAYFETICDGAVWNKRVKNLLDYHRTHAEERIKEIINNSDK